MAGYFDDVLGAMAADTATAFTPKELKELQFGFPLRHFCQQYLFGATGLRLGVFNSISGIPGSCKSPLLFDLLGHVAAAKADGGLGGMGVLYEMESKISPSLLNSVLGSYGQDALAHTMIIKADTINYTLNHFTRVLLKNCSKRKHYEIPILIGMDSIGGSGARDTVDKFLKDGEVGKGFYDKAHFLKYFCENAGALIGDLPIVILCINQEKEKVESKYGVHSKEMMKVTGGVSQVYKDGFMVHADFKQPPSGIGKLIDLRTMKTSFSDDRKITVAFRWNEAGTDINDAYGHRFDWAEATALTIAGHTPVGTIRDICDVKLSGEGRVTCPTFGLRSVQPEEFEAALMSEEYKEVREQLYTYLKIDKLKTLDEYAAHMKEVAAKAKKPKSEDQEQTEDQEQESEQQEETKQDKPDKASPRSRRKPAAAKEAEGPADE